MYSRYQIIKIGKLFSKYELLFLNQANFCFNPSQILMLQFHTLGASLPPLPSLSNFTLANWNPSSTQCLSWSSSVSLFSPTSFNHTLPQVLDISNHMPSHANQMHYQAIYRSIYLTGQARYPLKSWVFKDCFSFKVRQHSQQQLYLKYKACWVLCKMVSASSFSEPYFSIQPPLQSPLKIRFSTSVNFYFPIPPLLVHKIILTSPTNTPFLYTSVILHLLIFSYKLLNDLHQKYFPTSAIGPIPAVLRDKESRKYCGDWHCFNLSPSYSKYGQWKHGSQSLTPYRSGSESWCASGRSLW